MAISVDSYYVAPGNGTDDTNPGRGASAGDPWNSGDWAWNNITKGINAVRVNFRSDGTDVLTTAWDIVTDMGNGSEASPIIIAGYTATEGDGGMGKVQTPASGQLDSGTAMDNCYITDMEIDCAGGSTYCLQWDNYIAFQRCKIHNHGSNCITVDNGCVMVDCYMHDISGICFEMALGMAAFNEFSDRENTGGKTMSDAIRLVTYGWAFNNLIHLNSAGGRGIRLPSFNGSVIANNTIYNETQAGTGQGIGATAGGSVGGHILNNRISGFNGSGGRGVYAPADNPVALLAGNAYHNCATDEDMDLVIVDGGKTSLTSHGMKDPDNGDYTLVDGGVGASYPLTYRGSGSAMNLDAGAQQRKMNILRQHPLGIFA